MRTIKTYFDEMIAGTSLEIQREVAKEFAISNRIYELMRKRGLNTTQFVQALGKRTSEITKWLRGQLNFTIKTLSMLSSFLKEPLISIN